MAPLTDEDRLLIKVLLTEKSWTVDRMIAAFLARQWKRHTLFDLLQRTDSTGSTTPLPGSGRLPLTLRSHVCCKPYFCCGWPRNCHWYWCL